MAYHIASSDAQKLVLARNATRFTTRVFVFIGSLFMLIGILLNVFMDSWEIPYILFRILFPFFGALAVWAGLYLPKQTKGTTPEQIVFDHSWGAVVIEMVKGGIENGFIRYDEIEGFDVHTERTTSSSSSSSRTSSTYYTYHVYLKKKDGGEWFLMQFSSQEKAEVTVTLLRMQIPLNNPCILSVPAKLTTKISKQEGLDKTVIHWQNNVSIWTPIFLLVFSVVFLSIFFTVASMSAASVDGPDYFMFIVGGFIFLIFSLVIFSQARKMVRDAFTRYAVSVSRSQFEYYEFSKSSGKMRNQKTVAMDLVDRIVYSFNPTKPAQNSTLTVLTKEDVVHMQKTLENPFTALKDIFTDQHQPMTLSITALNPVECLQLENWLQDLILKKSNKQVM